MPSADNSLKNRTKKDAHCTVASRDPVEKKARDLSDALPLKDDLEFCPDGEHYANIKDSLYHIFQAIDISKKIKLIDKNRQLEIIIANILHACSIEHGKALRVSLNCNDYTGNNRVYKFLSYKILADIINALDKYHLIKKHTGFQVKNKARQTRIVATTKLIDLFKYIPTNELPYVVGSQANSLVILRNEDKEEISYTATPLTKNRTARLERINAVNKRFKVTYHNNRLSTDLHAVFNVDFEHGGRLYTSGFGHQGLQSDRRKLIKIDGQETVEIDFKAFHIMMLYAEKGIQLEDDPYLKISTNDKLRPIVKKSLLLIINADTEEKATMRIHYEVYHELMMGDLFTKLNLTPKKLVSRCKFAHPEIKDSFGTGAGRRLMAKDAEIAMDVMEHFTNTDRPILPIHDSFIVQREHKDELEKVMKATYSKHFKGYTIEVKAN